MQAAVAAGSTTGATPHQIADIVMQDFNLRDAVKAAFLKDVDDQCRRLCKKSEESSVLRVPRSKHKVICGNLFLLSDKN